MYQNDEKLEYSFLKDSRLFKINPCQEDETHLKTSWGWASILRISTKYFSSQLSSQV